MPRKAIDSRIPALIRNGIQERKRSFFVVVGDNAKDVIVHLHYIMSSVDVKQNKSVLWAYKNKLLDFTSHRKKREDKIKKEIKRGVREANTEDPFELFVSLLNIRYVYYKETEKILGNTYGMCILQDFAALTPNLLARTIETVEGGGLVLLLLKGMNSLKQLYTMSMDVHSRYRTEAHDDVTARFNERFILSLGSCASCLVVDDELNVLPISGGKNVKALPPLNPESEGKSPAQRELESIKESLADSQPVGSLVTLAKTVDQAKALLTFVDAIAEKTLRSTVTLTAGRGRGKSAALGVAVAAAIAHGYSNIFITSPSPENLKTLFEFIFKGFDALNYVDHADYTIIQSTNPDFNKAIVRVNVHRQHRQTIQYIRPQDAHVLGQAELLVIDEAAAIPLPLVRKLMGPYLVFMASTINGYEGTGRSLSLKLISQLREQSRVSAAQPNGSASSTPSSRSLRELNLTTPIRYAPNDSVEKWLNTLLCLDAVLPPSNRLKNSSTGCPPPSSCQLLHINRDTLFSFHPVSEKFLSSMMSLYVASHYKNSPNDLQLMSDAPAHQLFVLVPPIPEDSTRLPEPLVVIQVALEGHISRSSVLRSLGRGKREGGDLIPWLVSQQFQDEGFAGLSGGRIVRVATNPDYISMGYGSRAIELLREFYEGKHTSLTEDEASASAIEASLPRVTDSGLASSTLLTDDIRVKDIANLPPLFSKLSDLRPSTLDYLGVSYGLTPPLHKFWTHHGYSPVYLRQTPNDLTGEHTCVQLCSLSTSSDPSWLEEFTSDWHRRYLSLLSYQFRIFPSVLGLSISRSASTTATSNPLSSTHKSPGQSALTKSELDASMSPFDLKRLDSYANNMLDHHVILDLLPLLAHLYFTHRLGPVQLSGVQTAILLAVGLQRKTLEDLEGELSLPISQLLAMFVKIVRKISSFLRGLVEAHAGKDVPLIVDGPDATIEESMDGIVRNTTFVSIDVKGTSVQRGLEAELTAGGDEAMRELRERQREMVDALPLEQYEVPQEDDNWKEAEQKVARNGEDGAVTVSVKVDGGAAGELKMKKRKVGESAREIYQQEIASKEGTRTKKVRRLKGGK